MPGYNRRCPVAPLQAGYRQDNIRIQVGYRQETGRIKVGYRQAASSRSVKNVSCVHPNL